MFKDIIKEVADNEIYGIISLALFAIVFLGVLIYVASISKKHVDEMKNKPLEE